MVYNKNAASATGTMDNSSHTYGVAKNLTDNGFTNGTNKFVGWATSSTATSATYVNKASVTNLTTENNGTVTLYAIWASAGSPSGCTACSPGTGATCTLTAPKGVCTYTTACKSGYSNLQNSGKYNPICDANTYTVTYNGNGNTGGSTANSSHVYDTAKNLTANGYTKTNSIFAGWAETATGNVKYSNSESVKNLTTENGKTITLYAKWTTCQACSAGTGATCSLSVVNNTCTYTTSCKSGYNTIVNNNKYNPSCTANTYTVAFNGNSATGGTASKTSITCTYDQNCPAFADRGTLYKNSYSFDGWNSNEAGTGTSYAVGLTTAKNLTTTNNGTVTLYAKWTGCTAAKNGTGSVVSLSTTTGACAYSGICSTGYSTSGGTNRGTTCTGNGCSCQKITSSVTLDQQSGTGGTTSVTPTYGNAMPTATMPTRTNYIFAGYYDKTSGGTQYYTASGASAKTWDKTDTTTTLYARWGTSQCAACNPGTGATCTYNGVVNNVCSYTTSCEDGYGNLTGNGTATPSCTATGYTITYAANGGTGSNQTQSVTYNANFTTKASNTFTRSGYTFAGWGGSYPKSNTSYKYTTVGNTTLNAQWCQNCATVTNGTCSLTVNEATGGCTYTTSCNANYTISGNGTRTPTCTANTYTITLNDNNGSGGTGTAKEVYATKWTNSAGTTITSVTAPTRSGYTFRGYYTAQVADLTANGSTGTQRVTKAGTLPGNTTFTANATLYAAWCKNCTSPANGSCTLSVSDAGACTYTTSCNSGYTISGNATATPTCTAIPYTISYTLNNGTNASDNPSTYTIATNTITLQSPTRNGFLFDGWYTEAAFTNKVTQIAKGSTGNKTFYAKWASCPAHATCPGNNDFTCDTHYTKNAEARTCTLGTLDCEAGKYYPGTGTSMVDCSASDGYYCPGTGTTGIDGGVGCRVACPTSANGGKLSTSANKATAITQCRESLTDVKIPKTDTTKTGTANTVCEYTSGIENGKAVYEKDCSFTVTSCIAGYYVPVKSESPYSKQGTCEKVGIGNYRAAGTCNANPTKTNDTCMYSTCPTGGTTASETSSLITDCYISCATESIKDGTTTVGSKTPVKATLNYSGSAYPSCTYNLTCATGYDKKNEGTATATCEAKTVTVTLNHDGGTGGTTGPIYAKYNHGWYSNSGATTSLTKVNVPTKANYSFGGYKDADNNKVINANGTFVESKPTLTANTALTAIWQGVPVTCVAGKYYTGTGTTMAPCRTGEYCPGEGAAGLEKAYQGAAGCFIKCPKSTLNGTLSSDTSDGTGATNINQCQESLTGVQIPKTGTTKNGTANTVCKYTSGTNGNAVYEKDCNFTVTSCIDGYYVPIKSESPYSKQGACEEVGKGYYRASGSCNANPTKTNDTCMRTACPTGGTTAGTTSKDANACFKECQKENITKDGAIIGVKNPVTDAQGNSRAALIAGTQNYAACYYNASCADGYVAQPENSTTGSTNATCVVGEGWSVTYSGEGTDYTLTGNPIRNFTVATSNRTLPTAANVIRTGYTFVGWYENSGLTGTALTSIPTDRLSAITLYAKWTPKTYPVTVNSNNGSANTTIYMKYATGWYSDAAATNKLTKLTVPSGSGDEFGGYYYNDTVEVVNASGTFMTNTLEPADNMTIVAHWLSQPITCPAGKYYPGTGDINSCKPCESGYYCEGTTKCNSNDGKNYCGRTECPGHAVTPANISSQASATAKTQCIKNNVAYTSDAKHVKNGTASCPANADGAYNYDATKCTNHNVTTCAAGYYHGTSTAADACEAVGKGYWSNGTGKDRTQCASDTIHTYASDGTDPVVSTKAGTTAGTTSTKATDCLLELVPFTPTGAHGKGTQTCKWNGFSNYDEDCTTQVIRFCDAGYYRKNATDKVCVPAGADRYSTNGSLVSEQCPARTDADGNVKNGETAISAETASGKVETATNSGACMLRVPYDVPHGAGTKLCEFNEDSVNETTKEKGQYDKNCSDRVITSCDGGYYRQAGATDACVAVGQNYYRAAGLCTGSGETDTCMRIPCPDNGLTTGTVNTAVTACYKTGLSYTSTANHVTQGTQTCDATAAGAYTANCRAFNITKCAAGYYHGTSTSADKCEAVGAGYWSDGSSTSRTQCAEGTIHVYSADGVAPTTSTARGTTASTTSTASTACYLTNVPYTPNGGHGKGTQTCTWDGFTAYSNACTSTQIRYCDAGYYRPAANATVCEAAGLNHYSTEGALNNEICPARVDATGATKNGETTTTTASSPEACVLRVPYDVPHGTGTKLCEFNKDSVSTTGVKGQYDKNCSDKVITSCEGGYYRPVTNGIAVTDACVAVGQNYYRPAGTCTGSGANDTCMRIACPANGKTTGTTSTTSKDCYLEKLACTISQGSGQNTCHHDGSVNKTVASYTAGCTECIVTVCNAGYYKTNNKCEVCPEGSFCGGTDPDNPNVPVGPQSCPANYPKSDKGISSQDQCYRDCTTGDIVNSALITGRVSANNTNTCKVTTCKPGYYLTNNKCEICPEGSFCGGTDPDNPNVPVGPQSCPADWSFTDGLATKKEDCYRKCEAYKITGGTALPVRPKEYWPTDCDFEGLSDNGNECEIVDNVCQERSCRNIYELKNGKCVPCNREHALSYLPRGNCMVASCEIGYHPNGQSCEANVKTCDAAHAVRASQTWDSKLGSFSTCMIEECEDGYHIASNACVTNEQVCAVEHGVGVKEWNTRTNSWGECVATSCDAGYTNDPTETNERSKQCGQCKNRFSILGEAAVSTYIRGCEIAACLYQGELYNLENNECVPICEVNGYEDDTGTRRWDASRKKCIRTCKQGYTTW
ncbi:MAG: InlB B-repeat-containing protein [Alphaproteobacteria bacterium]|nr:InlB B-repeat-containing protein [Alphaproteobacteria bacterium]